MKEQLFVVAHLVSKLGHSMLFTRRNWCIVKTAVELRIWTVLQFESRVESGSLYTDHKQSLVTKHLMYR